MYRKARLDDDIIVGNAASGRSPHGEAYPRSSLGR
jgi:hypothetical protein